MTRTLSEAISDRRTKLQCPYAYIAEKEDFEDMRAAKRLSELPYSFDEELSKFNQPVARFDGIDQTKTPSVPSPLFYLPIKKKRYSDNKIEAVARSIQIALWNNGISGEPTAQAAIKALNPKAGFDLIGYAFEYVDSLAEYGDSSLIEVAGIIDNDKKYAQVSTQLPLASRNFTAAHELGHALLHEESGLHRDRALDGTQLGLDHKEREANKFATYFLMPSKLVTFMFKRIYGIAPFQLNEETEFALFGEAGGVRRKPKSVRDLSITLASTSRFNTFNIVPFNQRLSVSPAALAIRLEELQLVTADSLAK